ncbi:hypothetical protein Acsp01_80760 [Actinoplanes sp. NBRC 101535]|nr:hypothetical protein Acsp01_80760 [Actinoplanes sp. NBRC 101535]
MRMMLALVVGLLGSAVVAPAAPALALCSGNGCYNQDPSSTGCSASGSIWVQMDEPLSPTFRLELRKSSACNAFWGRIWSAGSIYTVGSEYNVLVERQILSGGVYRAHSATSVTAPPGFSGYYWTDMVGNSNDDRVRVCYGLNHPDKADNWYAWCSKWMA